ncbi:hypothetical protein LCGC14_1292120 [marine sediment metagenome]|uniref:Phage tail collar domain-containing protein n=1 Tax=marine sediment metagenome TaxID=412755 RepID=A0A0F9LCX7_9ZZZZ
MAVDGTGWDTSTPDPSDLIKDGANQITDLRKGVETRVNKEHVTLAANSAGGEHKEGSAKAYYDTLANQPTLRPDGTTTLTDADQGRPFYASDTNELRMYRGTTDGWEGLGIVPVGAIVAWHKDIDGATPLVLPDSWVECNGGTVSNAASPINGKTIPDLNDDTAYGGSAGQVAGAYIRGTQGGGGVWTEAKAAPDTGTFHDDALQGHDHLIYRNNNVDLGTGGDDVFMPSTGPSAAATTTGGMKDGADAGTGDPVRFTDETRPYSVHMVWIMRII